MEIDNRVITLFSDNRPQHRLSEGEVTIERLQAFLDAAVLDYEIDDDGDIHVMDGASFPLWITIDHRAKSLRLFTYIPSGSTSFEGVNALNARYRIVQFALDGDRILANYYMCFRFSLDTRHLVIMARSFGEICRAARTELGNATPNANQAEEA